MKTKRVASLFLVMLILMMNVTPVFADAVETETLVPLVNLESKTVTIKKFNQNEKKEADMIFYKNFNLDDIRVNEDLKPIVRDPNKVDGSGATIQYNQIFPKYFREASANRINVVDYEISSSEVVLNGHRSFGSNKADLKIKDGISQSTGVPADTKSMTLTYPSRLVEDISSDESKQASQVATFLNAGFSKLFKKILPSDATPQMFEVALEQINGLGNAGGTITVDGKKYTVVFPQIDDADDAKYSEIDEKIAKQKKENYIYYRNEDNEYFGYVYEGTMPLSQVEFGKLTQFPFAIPKGYVGVNGTTILKDVKSLPLFSDDTAFFTVPQMTQVASALYYGKKIHAGNITALQEKDFGGISGKLARTADNLKVFADQNIKQVVGFKFVDKDIEKTMNGRINGFTTIIVAVLSFLMFIITGARIALSNNNISAKEAGMRQLYHIVIFILMTGGTGIVKELAVAFSIGTSNVLTSFFADSFNILFAGGGIGVVDKWLISIIAIAQLVILLTGVINYYTAQVILVLTPIIMFYQLFIKNMNIDISPLWDIAGRILTMPLLLSIFSLSALAVRSANFVSVVVMFIYIGVVIGIIRHIEQRLDVPILSIFSTMLKTGATMAGTTAMALGATSAGLNAYGHSGSSKASTASASTESGASQSDSMVSGAVGGENNNLKGQEQRNSDKLQSSIAQSGFGKAKTMVGDTASRIGGDVKSAYERRGGTSSNNLVKGVAGARTVGAGINNVAKAGARQLSNVADIGKHGFKGIEAGFNGNLGGISNNATNALQNLSAIKNAGLDTTIGASNYMKDAYAGGQAQRRMDATDGVISRQVSGAGDNLMNIDTINRDMYSQNGVSDIETGKNGTFDMTYDMNNVTPQMSQQLGAINQIAREDGGIDRLKEMGIQGIKHEPVFDKDNKIVNNKMTLSMNSGALHHMGLNQLNIQPDGNIEERYNVKKYGSQERQYVPNAKAYFKGRDSQIQAPKTQAN